MADEEQARPIIVKKIKKGGHGHHGGAWKVAYADFVTAMMAFFLMLWLISSVDEAKLEGLAEYFTPTIGVRDSLGIGFEGGVTVNVDGTKKNDTSEPGIVSAPPPGQTTIEDTPAVIESDKDAQLFEKAEEAIKNAFESDPNLRDLSDNIIVEQTPEGLKIEIMDSEKYPMFDPGSIVLTEFGRRTLGKMSKVIEEMPNFISIEGHTDASPMTSRGAGYSNWELSADRANSARRYLLRTGVDPERPKKVVGKAASELLLPEKPYASRNRRITIILLRGSYMDLGESALPATRSLLSTPKPAAKKKSDTVKEKRKEEKKEKQKEEQEKILKPRPVQLPGAGTTPLDAVNPPENPGDKPADAFNMPDLGFSGQKPPTTAADKEPSVGVEKTIAPAPIKDRDDSDFEGFVEE